MCVCSSPIEIVHLVPLNSHEPSVAPTWICFVIVSHRSHPSCVFAIDDDDQDVLEGRERERKENAEGRLLRSFIEGDPLQFCFE